MTIFASRALWTPRRLNDACRKHGVILSDRSGEVIVGGEVVGSFELAGGALVLHDVDHRSHPRGVIFRPQL